jgi:cysteine-rich repeat protein
MTRSILFPSVPSFMSASRTTAALLAGLVTLAAGACDPEGDPDADESLLAGAEAPADGPQESRPDELAAPGQDPQENLLCILCILGGNQQVCGDDNVSYGNACWAACADAEVVHAGACACGDGYALPGEACDDGDADDTDACPSTCEDAACGDGFVRAGVEECDDGDVADGDGCSAQCELEPVCGDGEAVVDQASLEPTYGGWTLSQDQLVGQTFTVGLTGYLSGIELVFQNDSAPDGATIRLDLFDASDALLASATVPTATQPLLPDASIDSDQLGAGYFDLAAACVGVEQGQQLRVALTLEAGVGVCEDHECVSGRTGACFDDFDCIAHVNVQHAEPDYAGGHVSINGAPYTDWDLQFKTLVEP